MVALTYFGIMRIFLVEAYFMSGSFGSKYKITFFGESHGEGLGVVIDGVPSGTVIDSERLRLEMRRRRPGQNEMSTNRDEADEVEFLSGVYNGYATGSPICAVVKNKNQHSNDYLAEERVARPSHSDYAAHVKYKGYEDYRGGGNFSGRTTLSFVIAGTLARMALDSDGIKIAARVLSVGGISDTPKSIVDCNGSTISNFHNMELPMASESAADEVRNLIYKCKQEGDSLGGVIECAIWGVPVGWGNPYFDSVESIISHLAFSVPSVKAVEFGDGCEMINMRGSMANDQFYRDKDGVKTSTNHNGGINGGISNGMPIVFKMYFKPVPSIAIMQNSISLSDLQERNITVKGRHDPCVVPRAVVVAESLAAIAIMELRP